MCLLGILNCIIFYTSSKIVIYLFLGTSSIPCQCVSVIVIRHTRIAEKVFVVWNGRSRLRSKVYMGCLATIFVYIGVIVFLIWGKSRLITAKLILTCRSSGRVAFFRDDGACVIGLTRAASLTLLIYDL